MSDALGIQGVSPIPDHRQLPHFASFHHKLRLDRPAAVVSVSSGPIANQSSWEYARASPTPPRFSANRFLRQGRSPLLPDRKDPEEEELNVSR
jgi:hypothetical protein